jgi:proteasome lid subunit RPN8/RPN11
MTKVTLSIAAVEVISTAVAEAKDREICGFLIGHRSSQSVYVETARRAVNIYNSRTSFAISPSEYAAVLAERKHCREVVGIYHSHYGSAHLSWLDKQNIVVTPLLWLVVAVQEKEDGEITDWRAFKAGERGIERIHVSFAEPRKPSQFSLAPL